MIDITGLDRASVIQALYAAARPQGLGLLHYQPGDLPREDAEQLVGLYIDYLKGRVMKILVRVDNDEIDEWGYDRDNGNGAAKHVIDALRSAGNDRS